MMRMWLMKLVCVLMIPLALLVETLDGLYLRLTRRKP